MVQLSYICDVPTLTRRISSRSRLPVILVAIVPWCRMQAPSGIPDINPEQVVELLIEQIHDGLIKFHTLFDKVCIFSENTFSRMS